MLKQKLKGIFGITLAAFMLPVLSVTVAADDYYYEYNSNITALANSEHNITSGADYDIGTDGTVNIRVSTSFPSNNDDKNQAGKSGDSLLAFTKYGNPVAINFIIDSLEPQAIQEFGFAVARNYLDTRPSARVMIDETERNYIEFGIGKSSETGGSGVTDAVKSRTPYIIIRNDGEIIKTISPTGSGWNITDNQFCTWEVAIDNNILYWKATYSSYTWESCTTNEVIPGLVENCKIPMAFAVSGGDGKGFGKGFRYKTGTPYTKMREPKSILYRDSAEQNDSGLIKMDSSAPVRRISAPHLAGRSVTVGLSENGTSFENVSASFDASGMWVNRLNGNNFEYVQIESGGDAKILTEILSSSVYDIPLGKTLEVFSLLNGAYNQSSVWSSENSAIAAVANGVITGIGDGTTKIKVTKQSAPELVMNVRVVGEITYAVENGLVSEYLNEKRPILTGLNSAISAKDKVKLTEMFTDTAAGTLSEIRDLNLSSIIDLSTTDSVGFDEFLDRIMTYPAFDCNAIDDIYALQSIIDLEFYVGKLNKLDSPTDIEAALNQYNQYYNLSLDNAYYLGVKPDVLNTLRNKTFKNADDLSEVFSGAYVSLSFLKAASYSYIGEIVTACANEIGYDISRFQGISDKNELYKELKTNQQRLDTTEKIKNYIDNYQPPVKIPDPGPRPSGGGGGGSYGGSSGTVSINKQIVQDIVTEVPARPLFSDIPTEHWAYEGIRHLSLNSVIDGYQDGSFKPEQNVTRAEFIKILMMGLELYKEPSDEESEENAEEIKPAFSDVSASHWSYPYLQEANNMKILLGNDDGTCDPEAYITREQMAAVVYRALLMKENIKLPETETDIYFTDSKDISQWALSAVNKLKMAGIINGKADRSFSPLGLATRAEASKIIFSSYLLIRN